MSMRSTVAGVQRMFTSLSVSAAAKPSVAPVLRGHCCLRGYWTVAASSRTVFASWQPVEKFQSSKISLSNRSFSSKDDGKKSDKSKFSSSQNQPDTHQEWVDFQKSIAVDGFETGQTTEATSKSKRGGRRFSKRKSKQAAELEERIAERQRLTDIGGGEYPPLRYSDAETERLLAQAYAALPERAGKRGTRNLKRQKKRWWLVRQIRKKYKKNMMRYQERKMAERSRRIQSVKAALADAPKVQDKDRQYQLEIFQRWSATMYPEKSATAGKGATSV